MRFNHNDTYSLKWNGNDEIHIYDVYGSHYGFIWIQDRVLGVGIFYSDPNLPFFEINDIQYIYSILLSMLELNFIYDQVQE